MPGALAWMYSIDICSCSAQSHLSEPSTSDVKHASCTRSTTSSPPSMTPQMMAVGSTNVLPPSIECL